LGDVARIVSGGTPDRSKLEYWNGNIPWVKTGEINYGVITETEEKITQEGLDNSSARIMPVGTILMAIYGQGITRGRVAILGIDSAINQACAAISINNDISTDFLFYFLTFSYDKIRSLGHGANQKNLNSAFIRSIEVILPPLPEQRAIAHTLRTIQKAKEARQRELELERERKAALIQYLFTHGTGNEPCNETEVGEIAKSWKVVKFGEVCESSAFGPRFSGSLYSISGNVATLRTTDMDKEGNINYSTMPFASLEIEKYKNHLLKPKDFLITRSGSCGIAAVFESFGKPVIPGAFLIRFRLSKELDPYFLRYYINSSIGSSRISQLARGAIQQNISGTSLRNFVVPFPSLPEQLDIVNILGTCDRKITALEQEAAFLDELFRAMLEELMTGRLSALPLVEENALN
jgi:type I restriction enzyme S subunit